MHCIVKCLEIKKKEIIDKYPKGGLGLDEQFTLDGANLFSGILVQFRKINGYYFYYKKLYIEGEIEIEMSKIGDKGIIKHISFFSGANTNGYELRYGNKDLGNIQVFDMEFTIDFNGLSIYNDKGMYNDWKGFKDPDDALCYTGDRNILPYYNLQNEIKEKTIQEDSFTEEEIRYIAGIDVGYDELDLKMVASVVIYDLEEKKILETAIESQDILFNYCNDLFSYREVPLLKEAFKKLKIKPDLLICNSHGIAHPRYVGLATHLGVELDLPSIGCAKDRISGVYEDLGKEAGNNQNLIWRGETIAKVYRMITNEKPVFISVGHNISLESAIKWCVKLQKLNKKENYLQPYPLIEAQKIVNNNLEDRTHIEFIKTEL